MSLQQRLVISFDNWHSKFWCSTVNCSLLTRFFLWKHQALLSTGVCAGLVLCCVCTWSVTLSCDSCGRECQAACGTRNFRTCCFNYLRKRSNSAGEEGDSPGLRLELLVVPELAARYWDPPEEPDTKPAEEPPADPEPVPPPGGRMQLVYNA
jgi:hypothetical protein